MCFVCDLLHSFLSLLPLFLYSIFSLSLSLLSSSCSVLCCWPVLHNGVKNKSLWRLSPWCPLIGPGALELVQWGAPIPQHVLSTVGAVLQWALLGNFCCVAKSKASWQNNGGGGWEKNKAGRGGGGAGKLRNHPSCVPRSLELYFFACLFTPSLLSSCPPSSVVFAFAPVCSVLQSLFTCTHTGAVSLTRTTTGQFLLTNHIRQAVARGRREFRAISLFLSFWTPCGHFKFQHIDPPHQPYTLAPTIIPTPALPLKYVPGQ